MRNVEKVLERVEMVDKEKGRKKVEELLKEYEKFLKKIKERVRAGDNIKHKKETFIFKDSDFFSRDDEDDEISSFVSIKIIDEDVEKLELISEDLAFVYGVGVGFSLNEFKERLNNKDELLKYIDELLNKEIFYMPDLEEDF